MSNITGTVGRNGLNQRADVVVVQDLLRSRGCDPGRSDGVCGQRTITAIKRFQTLFAAAPDGLVEPGKTTWRRLCDGMPGSAPPPAVPPSDWTGDSSQWTQEKKLQSMKPDMATKVRRVVGALAQRGFQPKIFYGWRSVAVQARLFAEGKSKVRFSFHNAQTRDGTPNAYAADIIDARYGWTANAETSGFWKALGEEAKREGLVWGGDWVSFRDWAHVQLVANSELARVKQESGL